MVGHYLSRLEHEQFINDKVNTPPPECSSFYWNNNYKYKVFIPTKNRDTYINLEEYDAYDIEHTDLEFKDQWRLAKRNVCLALNENQKDMDIHCKMKKLIKLLSNKRRKLRMHNKTNDQFSIPSGSCKYYVIIIYDVKDIKDVKIENRYKHAIMCERIWLADKDQKLIDFIDTTFEVIAKRFAKDSKHKTYRY